MLQLVIVCSFVVPIMLSKNKEPMMLNTHTHTTAYKETNGHVNGAVTLECVEMNSAGQTKTTQE